MDDGRWIPRIPAAAQPLGRVGPVRHAEHPCAIPGCLVVVDERLLMCAGHWRRVPRGLQNEVYRTFRERQRTPIRPYAPHVAACCKAVGAVVEHLKVTGGVRAGGVSEEGGEG